MRDYKKLIEDVSDLVAFHGCDKCKSLAKEKALEIDEHWYHAHVGRLIDYWTIKDTAEWLIEIFDWTEADSKPAIETELINHFKKYNLNKDRT